MINLIILFLCSSFTSTIQFQDAEKSFYSGWTKWDVSAEFNESGWSAFGGSYAHTGFKDDYLGPVNGLKRKWSVSVDGTFSYPIVHDNKVFVTTNTGVLHVFDELTGIELGLLTMGSVSYVGPPTYGNDGEDDLVYVQIYDSMEDAFVIVAVKINHVLRMRVKWTATSAVYSSFTYQYGVASSKSSGLVYYPGGLGSELFGANYTTGEIEFDKLLYSSDFGADNWAPTIDEQGRVFYSLGSVGDLGYIGEVDSLSGNVIWDYPLNTAFLGYTTFWVPVVSGNIALGVVFATNKDASLVAVNVTTHTTLWTTDVCPVVNGQDASPAVDGIHAYFSCTDGIRSFSLLTGNLSTKYLPCEGCFGQPIVTEEHLFAQSSSGTVVFDKTTGDLVAEVLDGSGKMAYNAGSVYVSVNNTLFAYETFYQNITAFEE